ncbi:MAG: GNAT family N-acetyltransferase [Elusimicrobiota bacterium]|jgi:RimJ/RimL family protein N-acetyltransferase|nr:GNAT family N-acetyltransferase [Elusimicrobiota bacterium]
MEIVEVCLPEAIKTVEQIAKEVWREHYLPIISDKQIDYMLENFQSFEAISKQIKDENYKYFLMRAEVDFYDGYFAIVAKDDGLFLSKLYVCRTARKKQYAKKSLEFMKAAAEKLNLGNIYLTVNRQNESSIEVYKRLGFEIKETVDLDIGGGYQMNDYKMVLEIKK